MSKYDIAFVQDSVCLTPVVHFSFRDGRESNVVTKVFNVEYAEPNTPSDSESEGIDDLNNFQKEMEQQERVRIEKY